MRRSARLLTRISCASLAAATLVGGAAVAATAVPAAAATAVHPLGARRPQQQVAPAVSALGARAATVALPVAVDLRKWAVVPGNQGQIDSCVSWAIDYAMLGWYAKFSGRGGQPFAPMFTYSQINGGTDDGSYPIDALKLALKQGSDTRAHYSHTDFDWKSQPNASERANAAKYKIAGFKTLFMGANQSGAATALKQAIATNHPVAIDIAVRNGFDAIGASATAVDDDITSAVRGYHEVLAVGYDAAGLVIQNSWGTSWAGDGFGRISWRVVQKDVWEADTIEGFAPAPTAPTVTKPVTSYHTESIQGATTTLYTLTWKGAAGTSGAITRYDAWYQVDSGAFVVVHLATLKSTSLTLRMNIGHWYRIAVRASSGTMIGAIKYSDTFRA